jgi:redox-sensitive bicupin YhaK (pirin superfamily)
MIKLLGRKSDLGGGLFVTRILPDRQKRLVGPFCFLDHMGPVAIQPGQETDVKPHPHIGLSTLTYLFEGRIVHRDSLGTEALIEPGDVNWMTAGSGISHSERTHPDDRSIPRYLDGLQLWVALPDGEEETDPSFQHYDSSTIPSIDTERSKITLVAGSGFELTSPIKTISPLVLIIVDSKQDHDFEFSKPGFELGVAVSHGFAECDGESLESNQMLVFEDGIVPPIKVKANTRLIILGGSPFETSRHMWWNFVSSSKERIESAKKSWKAGTFPMVPGESEFIPLPKS